MRSKRQPDGGPFTKDTITSMLANPFSAGWVVQPTDSGGNWADRAASAPRVRGQHEPIITQELYDCVQHVREERRGAHPTGKGRRGGSRHLFHAPYLAAGLVRCRHCDKRLRSQASDTRKAHYRCNWQQRGGRCSSLRKSIPADVVDAALGQAVGELQLPDHWRARIIAAADAGSQDARPHEAERAHLETRMARMRQLLIDGDLTQQEYRTEKARTEAELAALAPARSAVNIERAAALINELRAVWDGSEPNEQKELAGHVFTAVYVDLDQPDDLYFVLKPEVQPLKPLLPRCTTRVTDGA